MRAWILFDHSGSPLSQDGELWVFTDENRARVVALYFNLDVKVLTVEVVIGA